MVENWIYSHDPDPGEMVTISGQYSNIGIIDTDEPVDAVLMMNGIEIKRHRVNIAEATALLERVDRLHSALILKPHLEFILLSWS